MATISKSALWKQMTTGDLAPVYVLFGPESHQRNLATAKLAESAISDPSFRDFNEHVISVKEAELADVFASCEQLPFGGGKRAVIVRDFAVSANKIKNSVKETDEPRLSAYLENPSPDTILVFVVDELDKRLRVSKLLMKNSTSVEFAEMNFDEALRWTRERFKTEGVTVDEAVNREVVRLVGEDAARLTVEAAKLATASMPEGIVTLELVNSLISHTKELSNFDLTNHLIDGRGKEALKVMRKILNDGVEPLMLLGMLSYSFRQLVFASEMMGRGFDRGTILKRMGFRGNSNRLFGAARKVDSEKLAGCLIRISKTDLNIKTSIGDPRTQIEMLVCELALK